MTAEAWPAAGSLTPGGAPEEVASVHSQYHRDAVFRNGRSGSLVRLAQLRHALSGMASISGSIVWYERGGGKDAKSRLNDSGSAEGSEGGERQATC